MFENKRQLGQSGEDLAEKYLRAQGHKVLGRNLTSRYGEVDIVTQKKNNLYFIEIKTRLNSEFGPAIEAISNSKKSRIRRTAQYLLLKNKPWNDLIPYFSVLTIDEVNHEAQIEFIEDAFE